MNYLTRLTTAVLLCALPLMPAATAQTRIGQVTLTPVTPAPRTPAPVTPARGSPAAGASDYAWQPVPGGMNELRGRIAPSTARQVLPAGSRIRITVIDTGIRPARSVASATFSTTRLPTSYQLFYGKGRLQSGQPYVVRCVVSDPSGRVLYRSADLPLPRLPRAVLDLAVSAPATLP